MSKFISRVFLAMLLTSVALFCGDKPKNIILLIGDGMGDDQVTTSVLTLENDQFTRFTTSGFSVTCSADNLITDSAAGGTAYAVGEKTNNGYIGFSTDEKPLKSVLEYAEEKGFSTGIVVTCGITHATPASFYAHVVSRKMENEIAEFLPESGIDVAIGAGQEFFLPKGEGNGEREDGKNVVKVLEDKGYNYISDVNELKNYDDDKPVVGLIEKSSFPHFADRDYNLGELTNVAIKKLSKNEDGFFLMVEGSQIDWGGHANDQEYVVGELKDFNTALKAALDFAEEDGNTLVVVTADHETGGMSIIEGDRDGSDIKMSFNTKHHTPQMVPVFAFGPGSEFLTGIKQNSDIGKYLIQFYK